MDFSYSLNDLGLYLDLHVQPNAKTSDISGLYGNRLKVAVAGPPVDGKANAELCRFFSRFSGVAKSRVDVCKGGQSRDKRVHITVHGDDAQAILDKIRRAIQA